MKHDLEAALGMLHSLASPLAQPLAKPLEVRLVYAHTYTKGEEK